MMENNKDETMNIALASPIQVGGESKGLKATLAKKLVSELAEDQLVANIRELINYYKANAKGKEKFSRFVERVSLEKLLPDTFSDTVII